MAATPPTTTHELLRIRVNDPRLTEVAAAAVQAAATAFDFIEADAHRLSDAVLLACKAVIEHAFDDPADVEFDVSVLRGPAGFAVRISDDGLPFTLGPTGDGRSLAARLAIGPVDRVDVEHRDEGNALELHVRPDPSVLAHLEHQDEVGTEPVAPDLETTVRALQRDDCESLARCVWRVYRYTYVADYLYHPDRVWDLVEQGWLRSFVAVDADGEVIGHIGMILEEPDHRVADMSLALTDPRYRNHHVLGELGQALMASVGELELVGSFAEAVTTHTITQRANARSGGVETGILLGFIPATMSYRGIAEDLAGNRQSAVLGYHAIGDAPTRTVALPLRYADELRKVYERVGLDRPEVPPAPGQQATELRIEVEAPRGLATIVVDRAGADLAEVVSSHRRELCAAGLELVYAELPLGDPATAHAVEQLHADGFFYAGIIPELRHGDVLRLQYLDVTVDPSAIQLYTDEAHRLLELTLADRT